MRQALSALALAASLSVLGAAHAQSPAALKASQPAFRELFEEMIEIDSSMATGSCTKVVEASMKRLKAAGYTDEDAMLIIPEGKPDDGNIVAWIKGADASAKPILALAHIDVVNAKRSDWERDPFTLFEENGFFYGRGVMDDKSMSAIFLDMMVRMKTEGFKPQRTLKMALTCGEEGGGRVNGVGYILEKHKGLIDDAAFAINEGAGGLLSPSGKPLALTLQAGEKIATSITFEVTNPGGHSSRPLPENAIYRLSAALKKARAHQFPIEMTPVVQSYFERIGPIVGGDMGKAMSVLGKDPTNEAALKTVTSEPSYNAILRTTCIPTLMDAGHAPNALPQKALATFSCRIMQGTTPEQVADVLREVVNDPQVTVSPPPPRDASSKAPALTDEIMAPVRKTAARMWPGATIAPMLTAGATDGRRMMAAGVPTYGMSGIFAVPGEDNIHGLNEKVRVKSMYEGREFLDSVMRAYVGGK